MINVYDFDKTIYDGDSTIDFYLFCLKNKPSIIICLPLQVSSFILYKLRIKDKEYFKSKFFSFLKHISDVDNYVKKFWKTNNGKIKVWYKKQKQATDVIISASPEFLLKPICHELKINTVIASKVDKKTGEFLSKNCYGEEKVSRYNKEVNKEVNAFYSDSMSDLPMMKISKKSYLVDKDKIEEKNITSILEKESRNKK